MAKVTIQSLDDEIRKILKEYDDDVSSNVKEITQKVTKKGVEALKSSSKSTFGTVKKRKRKYASTWTSKTEIGRLYTKGTIYNSQPGLPHLLEHGHAIKNGGRAQGKVPGREHIKPVEEKIIAMYENEIMRKL